MSDIPFTEDTLDAFQRGACGISHIAHNMGKLERENAALKADKARIDWLEKHSPKHSYHYGWIVQEGDEESNFGLVRTVLDDYPTVRSAIDAASGKIK